MEEFNLLYNSDTSPGSEYIISTKLKSRSSSVCSLYSYCSRIIINSRNGIQKGSFASTKCYRISVYSGVFDDNSFVVLNLICILLLQHICLKRDCFTCYTNLYCSWKNSPQEYLIQVKRTLELRLAFANVPLPPPLLITFLYGSWNCESLDVFVTDHI